MSITLDLPFREAGADDAIHARLKATVEVEESGYLWIPEHSIKFIPRVLDTVYGDGRALFWLSTINQRPAYWIIRGDSSWDVSDGNAPDHAPNFGDFTDDILTALEECFGSGRCGYSGSCLFFPLDERDGDCPCEECRDELTAEWPMVDDDGGCSWGRMKWPDGFSVEKHAFAWEGDLLREEGLTAHQPDIAESPTQAV